MKNFNLRGIILMGMPIEFLFENEPSNDDFIRCYEYYHLTKVVPDNIGIEDPLFDKKENRVSIEMSGIKAYYTIFNKSVRLVFIETHFYKSAIYWK